MLEVGAHWQVGTGGMLGTYKPLAKLFVRVCIKICIHLSPKRRIMAFISFSKFMPLKDKPLFKMIRKEGRRERGLAFSIHSSLPASPGSELLQTIPSHIHSPPQCGLQPQNPRK